MRDYDYNDLRISTRQLQDGRFESAVTILDRRTNKRIAVGPNAVSDNAIHSKSKAMDAFHFPSKAELQAEKERRDRSKKKKAYSNVSQEDQSET